MESTKSKAKNGGKLVSDFTPEQQQIIRQKSGKNGVKAKRVKRAARDILLDIFASDSTDKDLANVLASKGIEGTELATLLLNMTKRASKSAQMADVVFRLSGDLEQAPQQNITIVNQLSDEQLQQQINQLRGNDGLIDVTPEPPKLE
jgi:hypothetical protein